MDERLVRAGFDGLSEPERAEIMKALAERYQMNFKELGKFSRWGRSTATGVFERDSAEFVFVPGDTVTLGWAGFSEGLTEKSAEELREVYEEFEFEGTYEEFLGSMLTPPRTAEITPMLVERTPRELCGDKIPIDDPRVRPEWREDLRRTISTGPEQHQPISLTIADQVRFTRTGDKWQAEIFSDVAYAELSERLAADGYALPTADQWAYLCGGGCRTLFPWGDGMVQGLRLRYFDKAPYTLYKPNFFGLKIAYDPYKSELICADTPMSCGGDDGVNLCGGLGALLGYLPCSPHCKPQEAEEPIDSEWYFFRRIIRIEQRSKSMKIHFFTFCITERNT